MMKPALSQSICVKMIAPLLAQARYFSLWAVLVTFICLAPGCPQLLYAQGSPVVALKNQLKDNTSESQKLNLLIQIGRALLRENPDEALPYARQAADL
ncbi:MAG: hypothetical protein HC880_15210, partial [Bacteroidia bacterium]|nr:hypothetical protein [Bacteroidia bacterium]